jgi:hypothetical protein
MFYEVDSCDDFPRQLHSLRREDYWSVVAGIGKSLDEEVGNLILGNSGRDTRHVNSGRLGDCETVSAKIIVG